MTVIAEKSAMGPLVRLLRSPAARIATVDVTAILLALALPWSTSLVGIFGAVLLVAGIPLLEFDPFWRTLKQPICVAPIALFALAVVGTLWSDAAWGARLYAVGPTAKLLVLPVLFHQFQRSERGVWVMVAFLVSCTLLEATSWLVLFEPGLTMKPHGFESRGIVVGNYIDQSQEFTLCAVALAFPVIQSLRAKKIWQAALLGVIGLSFILNMAFVIVSRTALVTMPIMVAVFGLLHLKWRTNVIIFVSAGIIAVAVWTVSPQLEWTVTTFFRDYQLYKAQGTSTSIGQRLEFWQKSLRFVAEAPLFGHGTGSTRGLFERAAQGQVGAAAEVIGNPHNQTLNVAVQWGLLGVGVLYAMWLVHLLMFRGVDLANWIGLLVVVQNIFTSLFNSHIFDFHEGWMYVLGVGVAGGMALKMREGLDRGAERQTQENPSRRRSHVG